MNVRKRWSAAFQGYEGGYLYPPVIVVLLEAIASQSIKEDADTTEWFRTTENSVKILWQPGLMKEWLAELTGIA